MDVRELLEQLHDLPKNAVVLMRTEDGFANYVVKGVKLVRDAPNSNVRVILHDSSEN